MWDSQSRKNNKYRFKAIRRNKIFKATDIKIHTEHILRLKKKLNLILADNTGKSINKITKDCERDNFMSAKEALKYGLIHEINGFEHQDKEVH